MEMSSPTRCLSSHSRSTGTGAFSSRPFLLWVSFPQRVCLWYVCGFDLQFLTSFKGHCQPATQLLKQVLFWHPGKKIIKMKEGRWLWMWNARFHRIIDFQAGSALGITESCVFKLCFKQGSCLHRMLKLVVIFWMNKAERVTEDFSSRRNYRIQDTGVTTLSTVFWITEAKV